MTKKPLVALLLCGIGLAPLAQAEVGMGLRAGTMGFGADLDIGLTEKLNLRLGYNFLNYDYEVEDTDVTYDGELEINSVSALLDWHAFGGGFRFSVGAVTSGPKIEIDGTPTAGEEVEINGRLYDRTELGSLQGEVEIGRSVAPYIGIGYGNVVGKNHRVTFLFDLGVIYGGTPNVTLTPTCGPAIVGTPACSQLQRDVEAEVEELKEETSAVEWYPVINLGFGIRF